MLHSMAFQESADPTSQLLPPTPTVAPTPYSPTPTPVGYRPDISCFPDDPDEESAKVQVSSRQKHLADIAQVAHEDEVPDQGGYGDGDRYIIKNKTRNRGDTPNPRFYEPDHDPHNDDEDVGGGCWMWTRRNRRGKKRPIKDKAGSLRNR